MKYYSIQKLAAWEEAKKKGFLTGNRKFVDEEFFLDSYLWMMKEMKKRIKDYNNEFPIWLWLDKSNLFLTQYLDDEWVLLEIQVDEEKVLLSSFDAWHVVLNDWKFDEENKNISKEESWEYIFDKEKLKEHGYEFDKEDLQGTTGRIDCKNIIVLKYILNEKK